MATATCGEPASRRGRRGTRGTRRGASATRQSCPWSRAADAARSHSASMPPRVASKGEEGVPLGLFEEAPPVALLARPWPSPRAASPAIAAARRRGRPAASWCATDSARAAHVASSAAWAGERRHAPLRGSSTTGCSASSSDASSPTSPMICSGRSSAWRAPRRAGAASAAQGVAALRQQRAAAVDVAAREAVEEEGRAVPRLEHRRARRPRARRRVARRRRAAPTRSRPRALAPARAVAARRRGRPRGPWRATRPTAAPTAARASRGSRHRRRRHRRRRHRHRRHRMPLPS